MRHAFSVAGQRLNTHAAPDGLGDEFFCFGACADINKVNDIRALESQLSKKAREPMRIVMSLFSKSANNAPSCKVFPFSMPIYYRCESKQKGGGGF